MIVIFIVLCEKLVDWWCDSSQHPVWQRPAAAAAGWVWRWVECCRRWWQHHFYCSLKERQQAAGDWQLMSLCLSLISSSLFAIDLLTVLCWTAFRHWRQLPLTPLCYFGNSLDHFVLVFFAFVVLGLVSSVLSQEIGREERLRNDLFCVEWDVKHLLSQCFSNLVNWFAVAGVK